MPKFNIVMQTEISRTPRVKQLEGIFDLTPEQRSVLRWDDDLPLEDRDWQIGIIVGPSGSGKSTIARHLFGEKLVGNYKWSDNYSFVDDFPKTLGIKEITNVLSSVGFSTPPAWLRPFRCLSNGEQFRVVMARAIAENTDFFVIDEYTSVVDRTVAQIGSASIAKAIRRSNRKMIAVGVHYDVIDWLQPDWVYQPHLKLFQWRELCRRPCVELEICPVDKTAWKLFKQHHYLSADLNKISRCFCGIIDSRPVAFVSVLSFPHPVSPGWREHRVVCLPDFQGIGIGNRISEFVASMYAATGKPYRSTTGNPAMVNYRNRSPLWKALKQLSVNSGGTRSSKKTLQKTFATNRFVASFQYIGPARKQDAIKFGILR